MAALRSYELKTVLYFMYNRYFCTK